MWKQANRSSEQAERCLEMLVGEWKAPLVEILAEVLKGNTPLAVLGKVSRVAESGQYGGAVLGNRNGSKPVEQRKKLRSHGYA